MSKQVSIIIPTYNRLELLARVLPYYLKQEYIKEILIVNDSDKNSGADRDFLDLAKGNGIIKHIRTGGHKGLPAARNTGIKEATGDFILFGEDDVYFSKDYTERLIECASLSRADVIAGRIISLRHGETKKQTLEKADCYKGPLMDKELIFARLWKDAEADIETPFIHACALIKRSVFNSVLYDELYLGNGWREETDMYLRALKHGFKIYFCPHALCFHLPRDFSSSGGCLNMNILAYQYWALRNNYKFLKRHYPFLKHELGLSRGIFSLMSVQAMARARHCLIHFVEKYFIARRIRWEDFISDV